MEASRRYQDALTRAGTPPTRRQVARYEATLLRALRAARQIHNWPRWPRGRA